MKRKADGAISHDSSEDKMSRDILKAKGCKIAVKIDGSIHLRISKKNIFKGIVLYL